LTVKRQGWLYLTDTQETSLYTLNEIKQFNCLAVMPGNTTLDSFE